VHHSDAGSQYTALAFTEELAEAGIAGSIGTIGDVNIQPFRCGDVRFAPVAGSVGRGGSRLR
jgi:hypothetical protein